MMTFTKDKVYKLTSKTENKIYYTLFHSFDGDIITFIVLIYTIRTKILCQKSMSYILMKMI